MKFKTLIAILGRSILQDSKDSESMKKILSVIHEFCKAETSKILSWFSGSALPEKLQYIQFREIFIAAGFAFDESTELLENYHLVSALVAYEKIDLEKDFVKFEFSSSDEMIRALRGSRPATNPRNERFGEILSRDYGQEIKNLPEYREQFRIFRELTPEDPAIVIKPIDNFYELEKGLYSIEFIINTLVPSLDKLLEGSIEERREFREKFNSTKFFKLSNQFSNFAETLNGLGSEKALEVIKNKKSKGVK